MSVTDLDRSLSGVDKALRNGRIGTGFGPGGTRAICELIDPCEP